MTNANPAPVAPVVPPTSTVRPLGLDEVSITGGFWGARQHVNSTATLAHIERFLDSEGWLRNFDLVAEGGISAGRRGREFADSEVYKFLEAVAWDLGRHPDSALENTFRAVVARVAAAQDDDGYLHSQFGHEDQAPRWSDLEWGHELYCMGHLMQAAVARARTAPGADDGLLEVATRAADLVCAEFGEGGRDAICGHAEIELGLAELGRVTGERRYVEQAKLFVDRHGRQTLADIEFGRSYFQDDQALVDADALRGHAVRANYLAAGAADAAVDLADDALLEALRRQWVRTASRRTYITGGQGSRHQDEAFGEDWMLPPDRAYSETCAGIASVMFSWRMLLNRPDAKYADLIERTLFNVVATSPAEDGRAFFYANTLHRRAPGTVPAPEEVSPRALSSLRAPWFEVSCCPPNVARTLASLACYVATADDHGVQLHQFAPARIRTSLAAGEVDLEVVTDYPDSGTVLVRVLEAPAGPWSLSMRVPAWAVDSTVVLRGSDGETEQSVAPGSYATVDSGLSPGAEVELRIPMEARFTAPDPRVDAARGTLAVERGPLVMCVESVDLAEAGVADLDDDLSLVRVVEQAGLVEREGDVYATLRRDGAPDGDWSFRASGDSDAPHGEGTLVRLTPYHAWANRGPSTMRVWMPNARA